MKDYFSLASRNLRKRGLRSWLTILGIFIGIAAVVSLITLSAGLKDAVIGQVGGLGVDVLTVQNKGTGFGPPGSTVVEKLTEQDVKLIKSVSGIERVIPRLLRVGSLEYNKVSGFGYSVDMPKSQEDLEFIYDKFSLEPAKGRLLKASDRGKIILGGGFLESDHFGKSFEVGKKIKLKGVIEKEYEIIGIAKKTSNLQFNDVVFMMYEDMAELFDVYDEWDLIAVQVRDKDKIEDVTEKIELKLRQDRNERVGEETFTVETPLQSLEAVNNILNIINIIIVSIAMISLIVGGIGIANTMYTSVLERRREIGIMKAVGAKNSSVLWVFLIESGLLGLVGGIVGALAGLGASIGIANIANQALGNNIFHISISYTLLGAAVAFSFVVGIISGVLPAFQGSKLNVVDALRS